MPKIELEPILLGLKSADKEKTYNCLVKIRSNVIKNEDDVQAFYEAGGLKLLVGLLKYPNQKNLDLTLSILGNCCLQESCALTVGRMNVSENLVNIIQTIASDSILCRACRLIANLSTLKENAETFYTAGVVWALIGLLKNYVEVIEDSREGGNSTATIAMTIRALGILWGTESCRDDMISVGTVKFITTILVHHKTKQDTCILEFINVILKTLVTMTTLKKGENNTNVSDYLANQICSEKKIIDVLGDIIKQSSEESEHNRKSKQISSNSKLALSILYNLCSLPYCRDMLGKSSALKTLMNKVHCEEGFKGLILLCRDANVHAKARTSGALRTLLKSIVSTEYKRKVSLVLDVLNLYILDRNIIFELVEDGLINVIIAVINHYLSNVDCLNKPLKHCKHTCINHPKCKIEVKQDEADKSCGKRSQETKCDIALKRLVVDGDSGQFTYCFTSIPSSPYSSKALWSPQSDSTGYGSMDATPPRRDSAVSDDFESYSPICSDNEGDGETANDDGIEIDDQCTSDLNKVTDDTDELYGDENDVKLDQYNSEEMNDIDPKENCNGDLLICLKLLQQVTFYGCIIPQLAQAETILPLLKFIISSSQGVKYAIYACNEILGRVEYLKTFLKTDLVLELYNAVNVDISDCRQCIKVKERITKLRLLLQKVAESPCGVGEIENVLCLGSTELRRKYILDISLLIDSVGILMKILFKFGALEVLSELVRDPLYKSSALLAFINYGKILKKTDPLKTVYFKKGHSNDLDIPLDMEEKITFILDNGFKLFIDKKKLVEKSNVFDTMLNSKFLEEKGIVHLHDVEEESVKYFFKLLYLDLQNIDEINPPLPKTLRAAVEALMLTDKYLLDDLNSVLCKIIVQFLLKPSNICEIYEQSSYLRTENLKQECLAHILNNNQARQEICKLFSSSEKCELVNFFVSDLEELFLQERKI